MARQSNINFWALEPVPERAGRSCGSWQLQGPIFFYGCVTMDKRLNFEDLSNDLDCIIGKVRVVEEVTYGRTHDQTEPQDPEAVMRGLFYICQDIAEDLGKIQEKFESHLRKTLPA